MTASAGPPSRRSQKTSASAILSAARNGPRSSDGRRKRTDGRMCANCGFPAAQGHWTDAGAGSAFDRIRGRLQRARILAPVLASYGLTVHDDGSGSGFILANRTGHQVMVNTLSELWEAPGVSSAALSIRSTPALPARRR